jgi:hypothetical protein
VGEYLRRYIRPIRMVTSVLIFAALLSGTRDPAGGVAGEPAQALVEDVGCISTPVSLETFVGGERRMLRVSRRVSLRCDRHARRPPVPAAARPSALPAWSGLADAARACLGSPGTSDLSRRPRRPGPHSGAPRSQRPSVAAAAYVLCGSGEHRTRVARGPDGGVGKEELPSLGLKDASAGQTFVCEARRRRIGVR